MSKFGYEIEFMCEECLKTAQPKVSFTREDLLDCNKKLFIQCNIIKITKNIIHL